MVASRRGTVNGSDKLPLEKMSLILRIETDLKPNPCWSLGNGLKRDWLDPAVIQLELTPSNRTRNGLGKNVLAG